MIKDYIKKLAANNDEIYSITGKVISVDKSARTCEVEPINGTGTLYDVRLQVDLEQKTGIVTMPEIGSYVIVTFINRLTGYVALCSKIAYYELVVGNQTFILDNKGLGLKNNTADFKSDLNDIFDVFDALLTTLQTFIVITPAGPSTAVSPTSLVKLLEHKTKLAAAKTKLNTLLQ